MTRRAWTTAEDRTLRRLVRQRLPALAIAASLNRTRDSVLHRAQHFGLTWGRLLSEAEKATIRRHFGKKPARAIAAMLPGRTLKSVHLAARRMGLSRSYWRMTKAAERTLRRLVRAGQCNSCIARAIGAGAKGTVRAWRRKLGLPDVASGGFLKTCAPCMAKVKESLRRQLERTGLASLGQLRAEAIRRQARALGWPDDLPMRCWHILELLHARGPMTRREIAFTLNLRWVSSRKALQSRNNSYLAHLMQRGLVVKLRRAHKGRGRGSSCDIYMLALTTTKGVNSSATG